MAGQIIPSLGRVRLADLVACEGLPSDSYKISLTTLTHDGALVRSGLESARLFFHQHSYPWGEMVHTNDSREWCKTSCLVLFQQSPVVLWNFPRLCLGKSLEIFWDAISFSLNLRSFSFTEILDNLPLRNREISFSSFGMLPLEAFFPRSAASQPCSTGGWTIDINRHSQGRSGGFAYKGLHFNGRWILADGDLGPQDAVVYPGLALYQATAGYVKTAMYRTEIGNLQGKHIWTGALWLSSSYRDPWRV
ncbi:hypothetical protein ACMD2_25807 [Ananas comosus]|uniref:Uncharacterized protein n=1 Tax=Ananas comosus TaxID=4615 RepID=A0A199UTV1_ANACO|nr:hypothetical protein ACMD2_25807 [Ananas comosus]